LREPFLHGAGFRAHLGVLNENELADLRQLDFVLSELGR
jgi:hypothetical protein